MSKLKVTRGSSNVFADIGMPDADAHLTKAKLVSRINFIVREHGLRDIDVAEIWQVNRGEVRDVLKGHFQLHSIETLKGLLQALCKVE